MRTCFRCDGSGEGMYGESRCPYCKGTGVENDDDRLAEERYDERKERNND